MNNDRLLKALDLDPTTSDVAKVIDLNDGLPRIALTPDDISQAFARNQDTLHVLGHLEADALSEQADDEGFTALELAAILTEDIDEKSAQDSKSVASDLFLQGDSLVGALKEAWAIEDRRILVGLAEARIILEDLVPDPVLAVSGIELLDGLVEIFE